MTEINVASADPQAVDEPTAETAQTVEIQQTAEQPLHEVNQPQQPHELQAGQQVSQSGVVDLSADALAELEKIEQRKQQLLSGAEQQLKAKVAAAAEKRNQKIKAAEQMAAEARNDFNTELYEIKQQGRKLGLDSWQWGSDPKVQIAQADPSSIGEMLYQHLVSHNWGTVTTRKLKLRQVVTGLPHDLSADQVNNYLKPYVDSGKVWWIENGAMSGYKVKIDET